MSARRSEAYARVVPIDASVERVFDAIATLDGVRGWWTPLVSGSDRPGGKIRLEFEGVDEHIDLRVVAVTKPEHVEWSVLEHTSLDEWAGTKVCFALKRAGDHRSVLDFRHEGLTPKLVCYDDCEAGWDHFLGSLVSLAERGKGEPFRGRRKRA